MVKRALSPEERLSWHCSRIMVEHYLRWPCEDEAVVVYEMPDGIKVGWCLKHRREGDEHARVRGWTRVQPAQAAAA